MFRAVLLTGLIAFTFSVSSAQTPLQKMVDAEHAFARMAAEKGTRDSFLAYMTDEAWAFTPERTNAKEYWTARKPNNNLLSWAPNFADISSDGSLGYTTGNWEWRAKKGDDATAFGDFITLWKRQTDGSYKWVLDISIDHPKPTSYSTDWTTIKAPGTKKGTAHIAIISKMTYLTITGASGAELAYETSAANSIRSYRDGKDPIVGRDAYLAYLRNQKNDKSAYDFGDKDVFFATADLAYSLNTYSRILDGKIVDKGNVLMIWRLIEEQWRIVLDIYKPVP